MPHTPCIYPMLTTTLKVIGRAELQHSGRRAVRVYSQSAAEVTAQKVLIENTFGIITTKPTNTAFSSTPTVFNSPRH